MNRLCSLRELSCIFFWNFKRMMTGNRKDCRHERFTEFTHLRAEILQEWFIPDSPVAIKVGITSETLVSIIVLTTEILLETYFIGKSQETHRTTIGSMEECRVIIFFVQHTCHRRVAVHRSRSKDKRFHKHWNATKHTRHSVDTLMTVGIGMTEDQTLSYQFVHIWSISFIFPSIKVVV